MSRIHKLSLQFRNAIEQANSKNLFNRDLFSKFPRGCCGDTSDLLAQYLLEHGIRTIYVCGTYYGREFENIQSHAWLQTEDGIIIDITRDQFKNDPTYPYINAPVYVGGFDDFYSLFEVRQNQIHEPFDFYADSHNRLIRLYNIIKDCI